MEFRDIALIGPSVSELIDGYARENIELRAELADHEVNDRLRMQLVMSYVAAEHQLRDLNELKNRFLGIAAHDLRNPLAVTLGMSELLLLEGQLTEEQKRDFLRAIYQASEEMLRLVNDLLDVSIIESGRLKMTPRSANLAQLVRDRVKLLVPVAARKEIRIEAETRDLPDSEFDPDRMAQVIDNLVSNAIKFSPARTTVTVRVAHADGAASLSVRDQGPGLSRTDRDKLFGEFQKLSARPTGGEKSTGLGLAIVKKIVEAHGGSIEVASEAGAGAEFTVRLPAVSH